MDPKIATLFNKTILEKACRRYDLEPDAVKLLDGFESFIYEFLRGEEAYILRISHSSRRTPDLIRGEVEWINYLADHGVTVSRAVLSATRELVEPVEDDHGGWFLCTAFEKAPGGEAAKEQLNDTLYLNYGRLLGRMHALAKNYLPSNPAYKRYAWDDPQNNTPDRQLDLKEVRIREIYQSLWRHLKALPREIDGYGLIHQDAHLGNLFVDENYRLTLFDFDDCVYGHFIYDISMVLSYVAWYRQNAPEFTNHFLRVFFKGYNEFNRLDPKWLKEIPYFLKLREIDLFAQIIFAYGEATEDAWCKTYLLNRRSRIENGIPLIDFDWQSLSDYL
jgi:Ser/Thr protein kinase RdoA (MazF antagonist)